MANKLEKIIKILLSLLLFLLPWQTIWIYKEVIIAGTKFQYGTLGFYATEILLWILVILFIIWFYKKSQPKAGQPRADKVINPSQRLVSLGLIKSKVIFSKDRLFIFSLILFVFYILLSSLWSIDSDIALQHGLHIMETVIFAIIVFAGPLRFKESAYWFISSAFFQSLLGIWQFVNQKTFASKWLGLTDHPVYEAGTSIINSGIFGRWLRAYGSFSHPNILGGYLIISFILTILLLSTSKHEKLIKMLRVFILFNAIAIFLTFSKSAWIALIFALFVVFIFAFTNNHKKILKSIAPIAAAIIILLILYRPLVATRMFQQSSNEVESTTERLSGFSESFNIINNNTLIGVGADNYTFALRASNSNKNIWEYQPVHNIPLLVLAELGILGLLLFLSICFFYVHFFGKTIALNTLLWLFPLTPFLLFDHFFWSSYIGLLSFGVFVALLSKYLTQKT